MPNQLSSPRRKLSTTRLPSFKPSGTPTSSDLQSLCLNSAYVGLRVPPMKDPSCHNKQENEKKGSLDLILGWSIKEIVVAGTDTTSNTVEFALAEMLNSVETMKRVQDELEHVVGKHNIVEEYHIDKLPYLNATIKEVLRLHPTVPLLVPHRPSSTCIIGSYMVPEGSRVFINAWAIHRDPAIWKDPLEFKPDRFMNTVHERKWDGNGNDFNYLPFGSGRRICAGIAMAEKMLAYSLASLLHSFDWKLEKGKKVDLSEKFGIVLKKAEPLVVIPVARLSNPDLYY